MLEPWRSRIESHLSTSKAKKIGYVLVAARRNNHLHALLFRVYVVDFKLRLVSRLESGVGPLDGEALADVHLNLLMTSLFILEN